MPRQPPAGFYFVINEKFKEKPAGSRRLAVGSLHFSELGSPRSLCHQSLALPLQIQERWGFEWPSLLRQRRPAIIFRSAALCVSGTARFKTKRPHVGSSFQRPASRAPKSHLPRYLFCPPLFWISI
jgi:hypothetical protein